MFGRIFGTRFSGISPSAFCSIALLISIRFMAARDRELLREAETPEEREPALAPAVPA